MSVASQGSALVAMSGGVDSSVAAALLQEAGWDVTGVHLKLGAEPAPDATRSRGCCSVADADDARAVAGRLGIGFYVWDLREEFEAAVVDDFVASYAAGRTPNPCARCNERVKVVGLLARARALGFDALATGHYARVAAGQLWRASDPAKDQSYVLYMLGPAELERLVLPLGGLTKPQVRAIADRLRLRVARKPESYDVCFIPDGDTAGWLRGRLGERPGVVVDATGEVVGRHDGAYRFTVGQRRGLGIAAATPRYVLRVEAAGRRVVVGERAELAVNRVDVADVTTTSGGPIRPMRAAVQLRAHGPALGCSISPGSAGRIRLALDQPADAIAPGQAAVLYEGDLVLGGGTVLATWLAGDQVTGRCLPSGASVSVRKPS